MSFHHLLQRLYKIQTPKKTLTILYRLNQGLATSSIPLDAQHETEFCTPVVIQDLSKIIATQLSQYTSLPQLNQIYAHIVRTHMLQSYPAQFHWNNIIRSYTRLEAPNKALYIYVFMSRAGVLPDCYTFPIILKATCQCFAIEIGRQFHSLAIRIGLESNEFCESGFISLYSKVGELENARKLFDENGEKKLGSWNAIISGLSQGGQAMEVIDMFIKLKQCGLEPDGVTMVGVISACGSLGDLDLALQLHKCVFQSKSFEKSDILMLNSLIDMYGKCGRMDLAYNVFSRMDQCNVSSWTSMIVGYATNGHVNKALECFCCMRETRVRPNHVTFVGVLSACVHGGRLREGKHFFHIMKNVYQIVPQLPHYGCMVDLLGRAGLLEEAGEMIEGMPMKANVVVWGCLMGACEKFGNVKMGEWVAKHLLELEPWNDGVYVVLSNIYASRGLWEEVESVRRIMKNGKLSKIPGYSLSTASY
ncbi:hypothetical protein Ddye_006093 [Dipteronia dyeriana]|uniref:Pentatricopeptide repeat-containing protein n=1 Tax=Dipteronia dyeriana TaxID=168575 RepID=A0AAE0CQ84_9ROSI|nr:hypothetical protein Ddye_006093 [Dipteronia dyeriana]